MPLYHDFILPYHDYHNNLKLFMVVFQFKLKEVNVFMVFKSQLCVITRSIKI